MRARRKKVADIAIFDALVRVMLRVGPDALTLAAIGAEAGLTAGALVQRFGSKRGLLVAHARYAATTGDIGLHTVPLRRRSALHALRSCTEPFATLAGTQATALRNLAYLQRDLADPALHRHLLAMNRMARKHYRQRVGAAVASGDLRSDTPVAALARGIETMLIGSVLTWQIYRQGSAARWLRRDLDALLRPFLARRNRLR